MPDLDRVETLLQERLASVEGAAIERKRFSIAVHYRRVRSEDAQRIAQSVDRILEQHPRLHKGYGKKVFRIQPDIDCDKGHAVDWLLDRLELNRPEVLPVYVGDDVTDEDGFRGLAGRGLTIAVRDGERQTAADYALADPDDVRRFVRWLSAEAATAKT